MTAEALVLVALPDQPQADQRQQVVDVVDRLANERDDGLRQPARRDDTGGTKLAAQASHDPLHLAGLCQRQGRLCERRGQFSDALRWFRRGFRELDQVGPGPDADRRRARLDTSAGASHLRRGRYRRAMPLLEDAVHLAEAIGERAALAHAYQLLYWASFDLGEPEEEYNKKALALYGL